MRQKRPRKPQSPGAAAPPPKPATKPPPASAANSVAFTVNALFAVTGADRRFWNQLLVDAPYIVVGDEKRYTLKSIVEVLRERASEDEDKLVIQQTRLTKAKADIAEVERARIRGEVIESETVFRVWENVCLAIRRTVLSSNLSTVEKDSIIKELGTATRDAMKEQAEFTKPAEKAE